MVSDADSEETCPPVPRDTSHNRGLPRPTARFRLKAWREFQRALDPLGPPKPLRQPRT